MAGERRETAEPPAEGRGSRRDPRGLIAEAYALEAPTTADCRAIFLDWALGRGGAEGSPEALRALHALYAPRHPDHPMTAVLAEGLAEGLAGGAGAGRRRGGRRRR